MPTHEKCVAHWYEASWHIGSTLQGGPNRGVLGVPTWRPTPSAGKRINAMRPSDCRQCGGPDLAGAHRAGQISMDVSARDVPPVRSAKPLGYKR
jgi:hypothetical protein